LVYFINNPFSLYDPKLAEIWINNKTYSNRGLEIVEVRVSADGQTAIDFQEGIQPPWLILRENDIPVEERTSTQYGMKSFLAAFLFDTEGKLAAVDTLGGGLGNALERLLGPPFPIRGKTSFLDLQKFANHDLMDPLLGDSRVDNNLAELPRGDVSFLGVPFHVGSSMIQLTGTSPVRFMANSANSWTLGKLQWPQKAAGIPTPEHILKLYILHGLYLTASNINDYEYVADYLVHYEDGTQQVIAFSYGVHLRDWWEKKDADPTCDSLVAWSGQNGLTRKEKTSLRLYLSVWENPWPEKKIRNLDFLSHSWNTQPFCVAITAEEPPQKWLDVLDKPLELDVSALVQSNLDLSKYQGKLLLLDFCSSQDGRWRGELPHLKLAYNLYHDRGLEILSINGDSRGQLDRFLKTNSLPWPLVRDRDSTGKCLLAPQLAVGADSTSFIVGKDGKIISFCGSRAPLQSLLEKELGPPYQPRDDKLTYVDFGPKANFPFQTAKIGGIEPLEPFPTSGITLAGVRFHPGKSYLQLRGRKTVANSPRQQEINGISIGKKVATIYFLQGTHGGSSFDFLPDGKCIAYYWVHYVEGQSELIPLVFGEDVREWWMDRNAVSPVSRGWAVNAGSAAAHRFGHKTPLLYVGAWKNPHPENQVTSIDFFTAYAGSSAFCVAMTVEEP
jgi:hypothetical protein